jgi:hypothetical protein
MNAVKPSQVISMDTADCLRGFCTERRNVKLRGISESELYQMFLSIDMKVLTKSLLGLFLNCCLMF